MLLMHRVPNALDGRDSIELEIYGMEGVPAELVASRGMVMNVILCHLDLH